MDRESRELLWEKEKAKSIAPVDCYLGIDRLPFKMTAGVMLACAYWAQNQCSFERAQEKLQSVYGLDIDSDTIRKVSNYLGKMVFEEDCRRAEAAWEIRNTAPLPAAGRRKKGVLYMEAGASALQTRVKDETGSTLRESRIGLFFSPDDRKAGSVCGGEPRASAARREYVSYLGSAAEFKKHFLAAALRNGYGQYEKTVLLSDGAEWVSRMREELFGDDVMEILDFCHLREKVRSYARMKFHRDREKDEPWAKTICDKLRDGRWEEVLARDLDPAETEGDAAGLSRFIESHRDTIHYPEYLRAGLYVSGEEAGCGSRVRMPGRFRQPGMRWGVETAQYLLSLAAKAESGLWEEDVARLVRDIL